MTSKQDFATEQEWLEYYRHYAAAMAMQGICADQTYLRPNESEEIATRAVALADALITQLNKPTTND